MEAVAIQMAREAERELAASEQQRVIVFGRGGKSIRDGEAARGVGDGIERRELGNGVALAAQAAEQGNEAGEKQQLASHRPRPQPPARKHQLPKRRQHEQVGPEHEFRIIPSPRREAHMAAEEEQKKRWKHDGRVRECSVPFPRHAQKSDDECNGGDDKRDRRGGNDGGEEDEAQTCEPRP